MGGFLWEWTKSTMQRRFLNAGWRARLTCVNCLQAPQAAYSLAFRADGDAAHALINIKQTGRMPVCNAAQRMSPRR